MRQAVLPSMAAVAAMAAGCGACEPEKSSPGPQPSAEASAPTTRPSTLLPPGLSPSSRPRPQPKLACRAITVEGDVHVEQAAGPDAGVVPVLVQGIAPTEAWIDLAKGARLVAKDPRTTRETSFRAVSAPGRARACVDYSEESWVAAGLFESSVGAGEAPGAEEWVVTPFGVVRYPAAKVSVEVGPRDAVVKLESGSAFAWPPTPASADGGPTAGDEGWARLPAGPTRLGGHEPAGGVDPARAALGRCESFATVSRVLSVKIMSADGGADGGTIASQVVARRVARAACAVASMRIRALPTSDAAPLLQRLSDANTVWSSLP